MLGAIFGDIVGSVYEFDNIKTKHFPLFSKRSTFTDDSVMTIALADALMAWQDGEIASFKTLFVDKMHAYGARYPDAGYGGRFQKWLLEKSRLPYQSYGNGSAMRTAPVVWWAKSLDEALTLAKAAAEVTHDHPEGIKGALCTAGAAYLAKTGADKEEIRAFIEGYYEIDFTLDEIRPTYRFNETCQETVPQAMVAFLESESFEDAIRLAVSIGGDSDTLAAITGTLAEAFYGMTDSERDAVFGYLDADLLNCVKKFNAMIAG